jgi:hypothetical protein
MHHRPVSVSPTTLAQFVPSSVKPGTRRSGWRSYQNDRGQTMQEMHIFSLGRNEGRGVRIKVPAVAHKALTPAIKRMLETFEPGRDQNAVSPFVPKEKADR